MNEKLTGFRTLIVTFLAAGIGNLDVIIGVIQGIAEIINVQLSEGGAIAALITASVTIKQLITDAIPKLKGQV